MSSACSGMLSSENEMHVHHSSRAGVTVLLLPTSFSLKRNLNVTVVKELYCIFSEISKFRYW